MSEPFLKFLHRWLVTTIAVLAADFLITGISHSTIQSLLIASALLGFLNAFVRPLLLLVSLPLVIVTLGLFALVINALLLLLVGALLQPDFRVDGFGSAFWGALVISLVSILVRRFFPSSASPPSQRTSQKQAKASKSDDFKGPTIDI